MDQVASKVAKLSRSVDDSAESASSVDGVNDIGNDVVEAGKENVVDYLVTKGNNVVVAAYDEELR